MNHFQWPIRVYYEDTDAGGVVYHANYLRYFERARSEWLRQYGFEQDQLRDQHNIVFAVKSINIEYQSPALFNQALIVDTIISSYRGASITFKQSIINPDTEPTQVLCQAQIVIVCIDIDAFRPCSLPDSIKTELKKYV
ncbi:MAG: tol-pal system-associated acyl-CoA thioesterase [Gammaproteobacteria bacterium]|nr:tol-pal system-associated acyl-CoA thioesterase [Gammaproteobacteria bacterium]